MAISIRLPESVEARLERLSKKTGRSKTFYVREAIERHLEDIEDVYLAERTLEEVRAGKQNTSSIDDVMKAYGLET